MIALQPLDDNHHAIPVLRLKLGGSHTLAVTATSTRTTVPFTTKVISVYATGPVFLQTGSETVTAAATDHYLPEGVYIDLSLGETESGGTPQHSYVAAIRAAYDCTLYISERE